MVILWWLGVKHQIISRLLSQGEGFSHIWTLGRVLPVLMVHGFVNALISCLEFTVKLVFNYYSVAKHPLHTIVLFIDVKSWEKIMKHRKFYHKFQMKNNIYKELTIEIDKPSTSKFFFYHPTFERECYPSAAFEGEKFPPIAPFSRISLFYSK